MSDDPFICCPDHANENLDVMGPIYAARLGFSTVGDFTTAIQDGTIPLEPDVVELAHLLGLDTGNCP